MTRGRTATGLFALWLLSACGGGSGGGETISDTTGAADNQDPDTAAAFPTVLAGAVTGGNTSTPDTTSFQGLTSDIRFDQNYNLRIILTGSGGEREVLRFTDESVESESEGIRLYQNGQTILLSSTPEGTTLGQRLDYTVFGRWREFDPSGATSFVDGAAFFGGVPTNSQSEMPKTGTASYQGAASGQVLPLDRSFVSALEGTATATADFGNATINLSMNLVRPRDGSFWGEVTATDLGIDGDGFSGVTTSSQGHDGQTSGRFFGPGAAEIGGVSELANAGSILQIGFGAAKR